MGDVIDQDTPTFAHLKDGFAEVKQQLTPATATESSPNYESTDQEHHQVLVNFLDPSSVTSFSSTNATSSGNTNNKELSLLQRFDRTFRQQHNSSIYNIAYKDPLLTTTNNKTGTPTAIEGVIPNIHIKCRYLESPVDLLQNPLEQMKEQQREAEQAHLYPKRQRPLQMAWHKLPFCFVYFVTCQTVDDYRTKVKPAIQVFLSQLEEIFRQQRTEAAHQEQQQRPSIGTMQWNNAFSNAAAENSSSSMSAAASPSYLLVYCPQRPKSDQPILIGDDPNNPTSSSSTTPRPRIGQGYLANKIRQRMASSSTTSSQPGDDATTTTSSVTGSATTPPDAASSANDSSTFTPGAEAFTPTQVLTKMEKEIFRRLSTDFGNAMGGNVAVSTTLGNPHYFDNFANSSMKTQLEELERQEWNCLLKEWSNSIQHGFEMTCRSLHSVIKILLPIYVDNEAYGLLTDIILLKESLALTYQQMNLPAQALLQYNELRALLPDLPTALIKYREAIQQDQQGEDALEGIDDVKPSAERNEETRRNTSRNLVLDWLASVKDLTNTDENGKRGPMWFRKELKCGLVRFRQQTLNLGNHYYALVTFIETYLWERETSILFRMGDAVEVLQRTLNFCVAMLEYQKKVLQEAYIGNDSEEDVATNKSILIQLEEWSFCFCWDLKRAAQTYLQDMTAQKKNAQSVELFGKHLCDIVAYGRLRLLALAGLKLPALAAEPKFAILNGGNEQRNIPQDLTSPWQPWDPSKSVTSNTFTPSADMKSMAFLQMALGGESRQDFTSRYIDVARILISLSMFAGRQRTAARLSMELVGLHLERGEIEQAADSLKSVAKLYGREGWKGCQFMLHFRLAGLRRQVAVPKDYLATIVQCFSRRNTAKNFIPQKALQVLYEDFQAVMAVLSNESPSPDSSPTFTNSPVFETVLKHATEAMPRKVIPNRRMVRKVYTVGDTSRISLLLTSHLAQEIEGVTVSAVLVPFKSYVAAVEDGKSISQMDTSSQTVTISEGVSLKPGENDLEIAWTAGVAGQFVLTQVSLAYKAATFLYTYERMKEPFRIDIVPGEPTQSMNVKPSFFIPGHEQDLEITFESGKDEIIKGDLNLVCTPGLMLRPSSSDEVEGSWSSACKVSLDACPPDTSQVLKFCVKTGKSSTETSDTGVAPSVHAKINTTYCLASKGEKNVVQKEAKDDDVFSTQLPYEMEAVVPALGEQALSVENFSFNSYTADRSILSISAKCHVPAPFALQDWNLNLPSYLQLTENPEMDNGLKDITLVKGDTVTFCFDCAHSKNADETSSETVFETVLEDEHQNRFKERLPLRLKKTSFATSLPGKIHSLSLNAVLMPITSQSVGTPMRLKYEMDASSVAPWEGEIHFAVDTENEGWLLCGNTRGIVVLDSANKWALEISVIPTNPGAFADLPTVKLTFLSGENEKPYHLILPMTTERPPVTETETTQLTHSSMAFLTSPS